MMGWDGKRLFTSLKYVKNWEANSVWEIDKDGYDYIQSLATTFIRLNFVVYEILGQYVRNR